MHLLETKLAKRLQTDTLYKCLHTNERERGRNFRESVKYFGTCLQEYLNDACQNGELAVFNAAKHFNPLVEELLDVAKETAVHGAAQGRRDRRAPLSNPTPHSCNMT